MSRPGLPGPAPSALTPDSPTATGILATPHLAATLLTGLLVLAGTLGFAWYAHGLERRNIHALAPTRLRLKSQGVALQREAFRQPDLLPVYGGSGLVTEREYHASSLFEHYPSGFTIFPVGANGNSPLNMLQSVAAIGRELKGRKVVIAIDPLALRRLDPRYDQHGYAFNFSTLQAERFAFVAGLSDDLQRRVARRMLDYPATLEADPLLRYALHLLARGSRSARVLYDAVRPLGKLHAQWLDLEDDAQSVTLIHSDSAPTGLAARVVQPIDWETLRAEAEQRYRLRAANNPFGFDSIWWSKVGDSVLSLRKSSSDSVFLRDLSESPRWTDLGLLFQALRELGARALVINAPLPGAYSDFLGVSAGSRDAYYAKLRRMASAEQIPLVDFEDHDGDRYFLSDAGSHPSPKGWVYYDQVLDAFYHDTLR
jgi:D-alanine transfer protein